MTGRMTTGKTAILEKINFLARDKASESAHEAANGPANGRIGAAEVQQVLLGFVRCEERYG
jgi:hypothetical protein